MEKTESKKQLAVVFDHSFNDQQSETREENPQGNGWWSKGNGPLAKLNDFDWFI